MPIEQRSFGPQYVRYPAGDRTSDPTWSLDDAVSQTIQAWQARRQNGNERWIAEHDEEYGEGLAVIEQVETVSRDLLSHFNNDIAVVDPLREEWQVLLEYIQEEPYIISVWEFASRDPSTVPGLGSEVARQITAAENLSDEQRAALEDYQGSGWREMNYQLREDEPAEWALQKAAILRSLFDVLPATAISQILTRGVEVHDSYYDKTSKHGLTLRGKYQTGNTVTETAVISTRHSLMGVQGIGSAVKLIILLPAGSKACVCSAVKGRWAEQEVILPPGTQLEIVDAVWDAEDENAVVYARAITPSS